MVSGMILVATSRFNIPSVIIPSGIISSGMLWALLGVKSVAGVTLFGLVYGFVSGAFLTLASPAVAAFTRSPTLDDIG